jgi:hypothetical protein
MRRRTATGLSSRAPCQGRAAQAACRWPAQDFSALNHQRWRIEEASSVSWLTHQQDLAAKVLSDNLAALLCLDALVQREGFINEN